MMMGRHHVSTCNEIAENVARHHVFDCREDAPLRLVVVVAAAAQGEIAEIANGHCSIHLNG